MAKRPVRERSSGRGRVRRGAVVLAGCLLLVGCGGAEAGEVVTVPVETVETEKPVGAGEAGGAAPAVLMTREPDAPLVGLYAHLPGTLVVTEGGCVGVRTAESGRTVPIAWGHGWSAREEDGRTAVHDPGGRLLGREGDRVGLGGGFTDAFAEHPCATGRVFSANDSQATR
ncbi:hypothetical protein [Streptomyces sp. NPDC047974]|uniref:hypothetical protein n=1 Tax=Streptomyces sp. NPDC047974 TaxID=3154343 RepID=UPI0034104511